MFDTLVGTTVSITLNDVILATDLDVSSAKVILLAQDTYGGEDYSVTVNVTGSAYLIGWRNNRGTVTLDGNDISQNLYPNAYSIYTIDNGTHTIATDTGESYANGYTSIAISLIAFNENDISVSGKFEHNNYILTLTFERATFNVQFSIKDALTGQPLNSVTVREGDQILGTINSGDSIELTKGTHTLTFEKQGYWSKTITIDVQSDTTVEVEMYPSSAAFLLKNFPEQIKIPENTIYELNFVLSPITTEASYNTYLSISGLQDVIEVKKDGQVISPEGGKYYLGDISSDTSISIKFKAKGIGQHTFTITITSNDAIMSKTYTTSKQVSYEVVPLPFSVQFPSEFQVGKNTIRISETEGNQLTVLVILKDKDGNEVSSESAVLGPYEARDFEINIPSEGSYTLEIQYNGQIATWSITVNPSIKLLTDTVTVKEGGEGSVQVLIKNPGDDTAYYTVVLSGGFLANDVNKSISVAPLSEKTITLAFAVPGDLQYDAYDLTLKVLQGNNTLYQDKVHVIITEGEFSLPIGGSSGNTWIWILGALLVAGIAIAILRR
ncbi:hypothetical protein [Pyrococcus kukulkanii]|uniref:hypothetical protein n=1 Tax=Pyrococcus kukulkanii TaxID=1609559 RepID=UPI00356764A4